MWQWSRQYSKTSICRFQYCSWFRHPLGVMECIHCGHGGLLYCTSILLMVTLKILASILSLKVSQTLKLVTIFTIFPSNIRTRGCLLYQHSFWLTWFCLFSILDLYDSLYSSLPLLFYTLLLLWSDHINQKFIIFFTHLCFFHVRHLVLRSFL
jgi:hypothetical protein